MIRSNKTRTSVALPATILLLVCSAYLVVRATIGALALWVPAAQVALSFLPPSDLRPELRQLALGARLPRFVAGETQVNIARRALVSDPLAYEPFFVMARIEQQRGQLARAIALMQEVKRRRPSLVAARLQLVLLYSDVRNYEPLLGELDAALRMSPAARTALLPVLVKLGSDQAGRVALASVLARRPPWSGEFYRVAASGALRPQDSLSLLYEVDRRTRARSKAEQDFYLETLLRSGDVQTARRAWTSQLSSADLSKDKLVFNGSFAASQAAGPFNWQYHSSEFGRAEPAVQGGSPFLDVAYFGGADMILAEQLLVLPTGRTYRLSFRVRAEEGLGTSSLEWRVRCRSSSQVLGSLRIEKATPVWRLAEFRFSVPSSCQGQNLELVAHPGEVSGDVRAQIVAVEVAGGV